MGRNGDTDTRRVAGAAKCERAASNPQQGQKNSQRAQDYLYHAVSKQYFSRPATFCKNDPSGLSILFRWFSLFFSGSNQRISISLCQSRVLIPNNQSVQRIWSHNFEEHSLSGIKVECRMAILVGFSDFRFFICFDVVAGISQQ